MYIYTYTNYVYKLSTTYVEWTEVHWQLYLLHTLLSLYTYTFYVYTLASVLCPTDGRHKQTLDINLWGLGFYLRISICIYIRIRNTYTYMYKFFYFDFK